MKFSLATFLLAVPSLVQGNLRGAERELRVSTVDTYDEELGQCHGATCGMWGDPHIVTCDGLGYDCQGLGLFTLMQNHMYNIQSYFVDVGEEEHTLVEGWGLTEGASVTNDVIIDFLQNEETPLLQFGFGDISNHDGTFPSEEGCNPWHYWNPTNMPGQGRTVEPSVELCRERCENTNNCTRFSWWQDGGCHVNNDDQTSRPSPPHWSRALAGTLDSECGKPHELPELPVEAEESFHGQIGNRCPLLMHVDKELYDISDFVVEDNGILLEGEGYSVTMVNGHRIEIAYTLSSDEVAEIHLVAKGQGPAELWSCHWDFYVCLPESEKLLFEQGGLGLLGTPNGNTQDDWMTPTGDTLELQNTGTNRHKDSIDYCYDNWCVSQDDSLMAYSGDQTYEDVKCEEQEYVDFDIHSPHCKLSADKIIKACENEPSLLIHACEVDCCNGGCNEIPETTDEIESVKTLSEDPEDIQYEIPTHDDCKDNGFLGTGDLVCVGGIDSAVKLIHSSGSVPLPQESVVIYGIEMDVEPHDGVAGKSVKFKVNNPLEGTADVYIKHDKSVLTTFLDPVCDSMIETPGGCDTQATTIEAACYDYDGVTPFALVSIYFSSDDIASSDTSVDKCCHALDPEAGVVLYTFEIMCECPPEVVGTPIRSTPYKLISSLITMAALLHHPLIIHGPRRIRPDSLEEYKKAFVAVADALYEGNPGVKAFYAFADHHDPLLYWHVLWSSSPLREEATDTLTGHYLSTPEDPDTMDVYGGGWDDFAFLDAMQQRQQSALWRGVRFRSHRLLSGFIKDDGAGQEGPPMIGFTKRHVQAGRLDALAASFQPVLDQWQSKIPGILCAAVSRCDDDPPNVVHDIRIFANKAAYAAHTQKDDEALTVAMATWFDNYDRSHPFTGELYVANAPKIDTSSTIEGKPIRPDFSVFGFDQHDFLGRVPDMTRGDGE